MKKDKEMKLKKAPKASKDDAKSVASPASTNTSNRGNKNETMSADESEDLEGAEDSVEDTEPNGNLAASNTRGPVPFPAFKASTSKGPRFRAEGLKTIADASGGEKEAQHSDVSPRIIVQPLVNASMFNANKATEYISLDNACGCSFLFPERSDPGGQYSNLCVHKRRQESKVVITPKASNGPPADAVPQKHAYAPVDYNRKLNMEEYLADRTSQKCECAPAEDNRELVLDIAVDSPIYVDESVEFVQRKRNNVKRNAVVSRTKRGQSSNMRSTNTMACSGIGRDMSAAQDKKKRVAEQKTQKSRKKDTVEPNKREDLPAATGVETVRSATKAEHEGGQDIAAVPEKGIPAGDIFEKIEDLPRPEGELGAAALDQRQASLETDSEVRYKTIGGVTVALLLMVLLVVAAVVADVCLSMKDSSGGKSQKTSSSTVSAPRIGRENRSARIFIFMSEEESRGRDVAILDVNDEI